MNNKQSDVIKKLEELLEQLKSINLEPKPEKTFAKLSARANCGVVRYSEDRLSR